MKHVQLFEEFLYEAKIEEPIKSKMAYFYELQKKIKEMESELEDYKEEFKDFETDLKPMLDSMKITNDKLAITEDYILEISRFGGERKTASYKDAFEMALSKVNAATKKVLCEALEASKKLSNVKHSFTINKNKLDENSFWDSIVDKIKSIAKKFSSVFNIEIKNIDSGNAELKKISSK